MTRRHGKVGELGSDEVEVEGAGPPELGGKLDRPRIAGEPPGLLGSRAQVSGPCGWQPSVELVERTAGSDRGENGGEATAGGHGVVNDVRRDDAEVTAHRESGQGVVAGRVEGVVVVEKLDDDVLAAEPLDETVELSRGRTRTGFDERSRHGSLATTRQDEEVTAGELGQAVEVVTRTTFLAAGEMALADGAGETGVALGIVGKDDEVGTGRVGDPGAWRCRGGGGGGGAREAPGHSASRTLRAVGGQGELGAEDGGHSHFLCRLGKAHHPVEPVVVGQCQRPELEPGGFGDEFLGVGGTVEETEIRMAVELCVPGH